MKAFILCCPPNLSGRWKRAATRRSRRQGRVFFDPAGALRLPALRELVLVGLVGALRLPTLRDPDVKAITTR
ncbi:hypothetical protein E7W39_03400 [Cronobacter sakazakii]|nr:hypothetical protein [Cronobacter sakazakii]MCI0201456.1 hypothetical protein [Cronobacter sakazakii]MCI0227830.1 hypothetical protein [Cronobacter sakazakii]MCI0277947.1 hypothetical protein [Cronobacter sakazakii]MCI0293525.1 hypothetical protein [Cronobacter sakazakii]